MVPHLARWCWSVLLPLAVMLLGCRYIAADVPIGSPDDLSTAVESSGLVAGAQGYHAEEDGLLVGALTESEVDAANDATFRDWNDKELRSYLIGAGQTKGGFIYFRRNDGEPPYRVRLVVERRDTGERVEVLLPLE